MTIARHLHLTAADLKPGDQLTDEPAFTVATVELEPAPAVVAKLTSTRGIVRWVGQAARLEVRRPLCEGSGTPPIGPVANADRWGTCRVCGATCTGSSSSMGDHERSDRPADAQRLAELLELERPMVDPRAAFEAGGDNAGERLSA